MNTYLKSLVAILILFMGASTQSMAQSKGKIKTYDAERFQKKLQNTKTPQLIDVRTMEEYAEGHVPVAINYNVMDSTLQEHIADLNPKKPVFVYCRSGVRSMKAAELLKANGFRVFNLKDGITGWKEKGLPVEAGETQEENR